MVSLEFTGRRFFFFFGFPCIVVDLSSHGRGSIENLGPDFWLEARECGRLARSLS